MLRDIAAVDGALQQLQRLELVSCQPLRMFADLQMPTCHWSSVHCGVFLQWQGSGFPGTSVHCAVANCRLEQVEVVEETGKTGKIGGGGGAAAARAAIPLQRRLDPATLEGPPPSSRNDRAPTPPFKRRGGWVNGSDSASPLQYGRFQEEMLPEKPADHDGRTGTCLACSGGVCHELELCSKVSRWSEGKTCLTNNNSGCTGYGRISCDMSIITLCGETDREGDANVLMALFLQGRRGFRTSAAGVSASTGGCRCAATQGRSFPGSWAAVSCPVSRQTKTLFHQSNKGLLHYNFQASGQKACKCLKASNPCEHRTWKLERAIDGHSCAFSTCISKAVMSCP